MKIVDGKVVKFKIFYALSEAAEYLGVSKRTVEREIQRGNLKCVRADGRRKISFGVLERYVASR